jgi:ketosteroid isomerase-like protein
MAEGWFQFLEAWDDFQVEAEAHRELDPTHVLVLIRRSGTGRSSGLAVSQMQSLAADLYHVLDGKVMQLVHYWDRERALSDLGLTEWAMSQENVEVVRAAISAFCRRDLDEMVSYWDHEIEVDWSQSPGVEAGVYQGEKAAKGFVSTFLEAFDRVEIIPDDFIPHGEHVLVPHRVCMEGRDGIVVEARGTFVHTVRNGRVVRLTMYRDVSEALKAVGLEE